MVELPESLKITKEEYFEAYKNDVVSNSSGRLFDFSTSSVLTILGEAQSLSILRLIEAQLEIVPYISAFILESLGFVRSQGTRAVCTVRFQLTNRFDRQYVILRGTRFAVNGQVFTTQADLIIPADIDTTNPDNYSYARVDAIALQPGEQGNQPAQKATILQNMIELDSIWLDEPSSGGNNEETPDEFFDRVSLVIAKFLENSFSLVQSSEFELAVKSVLGTGSVAIAVPDLGSDGVTASIASMHIFAINPDGTQLNSAQIRNLSAEIAPRAPLVGGRLYFSPLTITLINVNVSIGINSSTDSNAIADQINESLRSVFSIANTIDMTSLELYEAVYRVKLTGALNPVIRWGVAGDILQARDLPLPKITAGTDRTRPAKINLLTVVIEPSGYEKNYTE